MTYVGRLTAHSGGDGHLLWERKAAQLAREEYTGPEAFASQVIAAGDINGDGISDLASCRGLLAPRSLGAEVVFDYATKAYVLSGNTGDTLFTVITDDLRKLFAADLNGDGARDVAILRAMDGGTGTGPVAYTVIWGRR